MVAVDFAESGNYFQVTYNEEAHNDKAKYIPVGTVNNNVVCSVVSDYFPLQGVPKNIY